MKMLIIESIFSKMEVEDVDIILIGAKIENQDITSAFFKTEELMQKALDNLVEDLTLYVERKQIVFLKNEKLTKLKLQEIFNIDEDKVLYVN